MAEPVCQPFWRTGELFWLASEMGMLTGAQIRMARGFMRWSVRDLAEASGVSDATIKRMELVDGLPKSIADNLVKIQKVFEANGVLFLDGNGVGPGVRMKEPPAS